MWSLSNLGYNPDKKTHTQNTHTKKQKRWIGQQKL